VLFYVALKRMESRQWNFSKESFRQYAMDKLSLMHKLNLPAKDEIHLLIGSITSRSFCGTAQALRSRSVDEFLEEMHGITAVMADAERKAGPGQKTEKMRDKSCKTCVEKDTQRISVEPKKLPVSCAKRRATTSPKADKKQTRMQPSTVGAVTAVTDAEPEIIGFVSQTKNSNVLTMDGSPICINMLNREKCSLLAIIDTGSPVSFITPNMIQDHFGKSCENLRPSINGPTSNGLTQ